MYDSYGRKFFITREEWRKNALPGTIQSYWNDPDHLYGIIVCSLGDGFFPDILKAAEQLNRIDPIPSRGACIYGIVLFKNDRLDEAEKVFLDFMAKHGEDGVILNNLAKIYSKRNNNQKAEDTL